jgi:hypothetical protein
MKIFFLAVLVGLATANIASAQDPPCTQSPSSPVVEAQKKAQAHLQAHDYSKIEKELVPLVAAHPEACQLRILLGEAYLYSKDDPNAAVQFRRVLAQDPQNRKAKLEMARIYGYHSKYTLSNQLYRELLATNPSDEQASIGLARNLIRTNQTAEASAAINAGLAAHPNSLRLQEYKDALSRPPQREAGKTAIPLHPHDVQTWVYFVNDSAGDRIVENLSRLNMQLSKKLFAQVATNYRHLSSIGTVVETADGNNENTGGDSNIVATTVDASARLNYHITPWLMFTGGGGGIRYYDGTSRVLFQSGLELHPVRSLYIDANYLRTPVVPTQQAATYDLAAQGLRTSFDWSPGKLRLRVDASEFKYTDGNLRHAQNLEVIRWFGTGPVQLGGGYSGSHFTFSKTLHHGYFSRDKYLNHTGIAAVRIRYHRKFDGEYRAGAGGESISGLPFRAVYEVSAQNTLRLGQWDIHADYTRFQFTQSTGAFQTNVAAVGVKFHF